jgi:hypothetical protein
MKLSRYLSIFLLIGIFCFSPRCRGQNSSVNSGPSGPSVEVQNQSDDRSSYESFIRNYRVGPLRAALGGTQGNIELVITVVKGDDLPTNPASVALLGPFYRVSWHSLSISVDGTISSSTVSSMDVSGAGPGTLPKDSFEKLNELLRQLPDDGSKLPPPGHRIVLRVTTGDKIVARVYDLENMPETVLEILRFTESGIRPMTQDFSAQEKWPSSAFSQVGIPPDAIRFRGPNKSQTIILAISPAGDMGVRQDFQLTWDPTTVTITDATGAKVIRVLRVPQPKTLNHGVGITEAHFTPDARYLLLLTTLPGMMIYDTKDWQLLGSLPDLPPDASLYYPSSDWKHGVVVSANGGVELWDAEARRQTAKIDAGGELSEVSFSPDESMVATTASQENKDQSTTFHLRVWNLSTGEMIEELLPAEYVEHDVIGEPIWWLNGRYLLAEVRNMPFRTNYEIGIWSIAAGRFRGEFTGCSWSPDPFSIVLSDSKLFQRCRDGMIYMWDAAGAISKIEAYEHSIHSPASNQ